MYKREAREVKLLTGEPVAPSMLLVVVCSVLSLVYLVSLFVMGTCSGLPTAARTGDSQSFTPQVKNSFWGEAPLGDGWGEKTVGGKLACTILDKTKGLGLYK